MKSESVKLECFKMIERNYKVSKMFIVIIVPIPYVESTYPLLFCL